MSHLYIVSGPGIARASAPMHRAAALPYGARVKLQGVAVSGGGDS
jgi:hypothetical protein